MPLRSSGEERRGTGGRDPHPAFVIFLLLGVIALQAGLQAITLPLAAFNHADWQSWQVDHPYHWYQIRIAEDLFKDGLLVGYDPRFAAGYLGGLPFNPSGKLPAFLAILLSPWLSQAASYKLYLFGASLVAAGCAPLAAYWSRCSRPVMLVASLLALGLWWASAFRWFYTVGMVSFALAACLALPFFARLRHLLEGRFAPVGAIALGLVGALGFLLHPLFPLLVFFLFLPDAVTRHRRYLTWPALATVALVGAISLAPNLLWILSTLTLPGIANGADPYQKTVSLLKIVQEALGTWGRHAQGARINPLLLLLSLVGFGGAMARPAGSDRRQLLGALMLSWGLAVVYGCLGAAIPALAILQPNRFSPAAYLFLVIPAAEGAIALVGWMRDQRLQPSVRVLSSAVLTLALAMAAFVANEVRQETSASAATPHYGHPPPVSAPLGEMSQWIIAFLRQETDTTGRVLFETSLGRVHDGGHMAGYYATESGREFIGGPYPYTFFAGFWDGWVFGKPIAALKPDEFQRYLELYNIHWIIVHFAATKQYLRTLPGIEPVTSRFGIDIFRVKSPSTFFFEGSGRVTQSATNHLRLTDLSPGAVAIKYHYVPGLVATPPVAIEPELRDGDPEPFIRLQNGQVRDLQLSWVPKR